MGTRSVCVAAVVFGLYAAHAHAQPIERIEAGMVIAGSETRPVPLGEERLQVTIDGQHASSTLLQVFHNPSSIQIEGRYHLRPGAGSHVDGFAYWNGETKIVGEVFERQTARRVYDSVTTRRRDPGLLEADGEGAFAFKVFPIAPDENKRVEVSWTKWLERRAHTVRYRAPVTRADAEIVVTIDGPIKNLRSPTHRFQAEQRAGGGVRLRPETKQTPTELVLEWEVDDADWTPSVYAHPDATNEGWFALSLAAPDLPASAVAAKDTTIVIDRSGSMIGEPMDHAKAAAIDMIKLLDANDRVNVIAFSDEVDPLFESPQTLDDNTRRRAIAFVAKLHEGGGTDIALALRTAIGSQDVKPGRPRVVVFMTDGQSEVEQAMQAARTDTKDIRLFTLGLGKEVNKPLLSRLAALKRGSFVFIESAATIETEVGRLAARIAKPLLVDVSVEVEGAQALRMYPRTLPDLFAQDELVVTGRLRGTGTARFIVRGKLEGKPVAFKTAVDLAKAPRRPWVGALWAQARVDHLLEELSLTPNKPEFLDEIVELALAYNFVTPYTAFLAIPESELGEMTGTVAAARERKRKILADNADVAALKAPDTGASFGSGQGGPLPTSVAPAPPMGRGNADEEADAEPRNRETTKAASAGDSSYGTVHQHGCAGCATPGGGRGGPATLALLALAIASVVIRRRRRA
jgi:Ca-activated chloride channel family protein